MRDIGQGSFVAPGVQLAENVKIGRNCQIAGVGVIGDGVTIGNSVCIDGDVTIGQGTRIGHGVVIMGRVVIGARNRFHSYCVIGEGPMYPDKPDSSGAVIIGNENVLREYVSVNAPALTEATRIGDECYLMGYAHVSHDCQVDDHVKIALHATLAGSVTVGANTYVGMHAAIHQGLLIGPHAMLGMANPILKNVPPYAVVHSGKFSKINAIGLARRGFSSANISSIESYYKTGNIETCSEEIRLVLDSFFKAHLTRSTYVFSSKTV
jgi:UDP-N-acetylglucosamine acyltransferase